MKENKNTPPITLSEIEAEKNRVKTRRINRYLLSRIKTELTDGVEPPELPEGFKETFESNPKFRGWMGYCVSWDVDDSGWGVVLLDKSAEKQWTEKLLEVVPEIPKVIDAPKKKKSLLSRFG